MITADTITDAQIHELLRLAITNKQRATVVICKLALGESVTYRSASQTQEARARCAEILNARGGQS